MLEVTTENSKGQTITTAELEKEDLSSVTFLSNIDQISDEQTKQITYENKQQQYVAEEKLETIDTEGENILMQNQITSDTEMLTSNDKQES
ncbi:5738_t:CDS:2 [Cetraspora pellucida]|uniref:5738_t:CDS:1 n=1 Tax=Cetraspora pellucida TaxID=1433469 RepID=A0A9N9EE20_9GLOM|nr:5738_t:CDS:2 [Cetraspora pellucida]